MRVTLATNDEPASPVLPLKSDRLSQPPEIYSLGLFFMDSKELKNYHEAQQSKDFPEWQLAMDSEINSIHANHTWDLIEPPKNRRTLSSCWVFSLKQTTDSVSPKEKAKIVTKEF